MCCNDLLCCMKVSIAGQGDAEESCDVSAVFVVAAYCHSNIDIMTVVELLFGCLFSQKCIVAR